MVSRAEGTDIPDKAHRLVRPLSAPDERERVMERQRLIMRVAPCCMLELDPKGLVLSANDDASSLLGESAEALVGRDIATLLDPSDAAELSAFTTQAGTGTLRRELRLRTVRGPMHVLFSLARVEEQGRLEGLVCVMLDLTEQKQLETNLRHAQKLEAVGQLAAGIAHEINTPVQFVGDSAWFLRDAFGDLEPVLEAARAVTESPEPAAVAALEAALDAADVEYLMSEAPTAFESVASGLRRIEEIVRAMRAFAHPNLQEKVPVDLNSSVQTALVMARNAYRYVADVETDLGPIPSVPCHAGDVNQVILNLVVNAAQALEDCFKRAEAGAEKRGLITVRTLFEEETGCVVVSIGDNGPGIPAAIQERIFEPFFTTKPVGRGTGQGLSISRSIAMNHGGSLRFETTPRVGTTFFLRLPIESKGESGGAES